MKPGAKYKRIKLMIAEIIRQTDIDDLGQGVRISRLAVGSLVFGILGPFLSGVMWIASFNNFLLVKSPFMMNIFSCSVAWMLGLVFGIKSLEQIRNSDGQLAGKEYAFVGIIVSTVWMFFISVSVFLPAIYAVNS